MAELFRNRYQQSERPWKHKSLYNSGTKVLSILLAVMFFCENTRKLQNPITFQATTFGSGVFGFAVNQIHLSFSVLELKV